MPRIALVCLLFALFVHPAVACPDRCTHGLLDHHAADAHGDAVTESTDTEKDDDWDVNVPQGPYQDLAYTTSEGTWMSVDVSPDGATLVFDHLGDLWSMPLAGGAATRLTKGMAWDYQPRWSPDGAEIMFSSDRSGGLNLWVMNADGSDPKALTDAGEKDTNSGAWSQDGEWIAAKRRLTDTSSIGTTELWMYHRSGGEGVQVSKKADLPEVSSPVFHPDGRFLYFSSRPTRFGYDRNPHQGLYQIRRFDRLAGVTSLVTDRWGGAGRPALSPDGKTLSFVSRDGLETVLVLHDLESGAEHVLYRGLDHDLQESFAWAGVYPGMDWTPDGRGIVLWAKGGLWRVDVATGDAAAIPFSLDVELQAQDALRFEPNVASDTFTAKILRWTHASPDDGRIVFSALGRLYTADADGENPRVLLNKDDDTTFEYAPRFNHDGKKLAYVTWNDVAKGQVWTAGANGKSPKQLTRIAGQWTNPGWSVDGSELLALKGSGGTLRGQTLGGELYHEIWLFEVKSGKASYVTTVASRGSSSRMPAPVFGPSGQRIWFMRDGKDNQTELVSVQRDGTDERIHVRSKYGEEYTVSPDMKWVAYKRLHEAYLAPLTTPGLGVLDLSDSDGSVKVFKLTDELVDWLNWEDAETITWSSANELYRQTLAKATAEPAEKDDEEEGDADAVEGAEEAVVVPDPNAPAAITITLEVDRARPAGVLVIDDARLITMNGDEVVEHGRLVIEGNRIIAVGARDDVAIPAGAEVLDAAGLTAIPGLVDAHAHMGYNSMDILPQRDWQYYANLAYGVTATMDPSASTHLVFAQSEMVEAGLMKGPRVYSTGFILYGADIAGRAPTKTYDDALRHVRRMKKQGAFAIKSYMQPKRIQRQWYVKACRELEMLDFPEGGGNFENNMGMILDGHTGIEHTTPVAPLYDDIQQMWSRTKVGYTPTFLVAYGGLSGENWFYQHEPPIWNDPKLTRFTPKAVVESRSRRLPVHAYDGDWHHMTVAKSATEMLRKGVMVNLGAHGQRQGLGCHWDLWALAQGGATNHEVLRMGTINPATYIGLGNQLGSLEAGKLADVVLLGANPLDDIRNTNTVTYTVKNGEVYEAETMNQTWPTEVERLPFVWE